jgi:hypothetical protein
MEGVAIHALDYPPELEWLLFSSTYEGIYVYTPPFFARNIAVALLAHTSPMFGPVLRLAPRHLSLQCLASDCRRFNQVLQLPTNRPLDGSRKTR